MDVATRVLQDIQFQNWRFRDPQCRSNARQHETCKAGLCWRLPDVFTVHLSEGGFLYLGWWTNPQLLEQCSGGTHMICQALQHLRQLRVTAKHDCLCEKPELYHAIHQQHPGSTYCAKALNLSR